MKSTNAEAHLNSHYRARNYFEDPVISEYFYVKEMQVYFLNAWKAAYIKRGRRLVPDPKCSLDGAYARRNYYPFVIDAFEKFLASASSAQSLNNINQSIYGRSRSELITKYKKYNTSRFSAPAIKSVCPTGCSLLKLSSRVSLDALKEKYKKAHKMNHPDRGGPFQSLIEINEAYRLAHDLLCKDMFKDAKQGQWLCSFTTPDSAEGFISWVAVVLANTYSDEWDIDGAFNKVMFLRDNQLIDLIDNAYVRSYLFNGLMERILKQLNKAGQNEKAIKLVSFAKKVKKLSSHKAEELEKVRVSKKKLRLSISHPRQAINAFKAGLINERKRNDLMEGFTLAEQENSFKEPQLPSPVDESIFKPFDPESPPSITPEEAEPPIPVNTAQNALQDRDEQYELAVKYMNGEGVKQDHAEAARLFRNVAKFDANRQLEAQFSLGQIYESDKGVPQNFSQAVRWYTRAAKGGFGDAQYRLGEMHFIGLGVAQDFTAALKWFLKAAKRNDNNEGVQHYLREIYSRGVGLDMALKHITLNRDQRYETFDKAHDLFFGEGVEKDHVEAAKLFHLLAKDDRLLQLYEFQLEAQFFLGQIYESDEGVPKNLEEALKWYTRSAKSGDPDAQYRLGQMYYTGENVPQDYAEALKWFRKAARKGNDDAFAQYFLGEIYRKGEGVSQDAVAAVKWYHKAAEKGDIDAQYSMGLAYTLGEGVKENYVKATKWFRLAAEQGHGHANNQLGVKYDNGQEVPKSYADAVKWAHEAIKSGDWSLQWDLGVTYKDGKEIPESYAEALAWYCDQAEKTGDDEPDWPEGLGMMYEEGNGVYQDFAQAAVWYRRAAERGGSLAQRNLAALYESGQGVPQNFSRAYVWYSVNMMLYGPEMENYEQEATEELRNLKNLLSKAELETANKMAYELYLQVESAWSTRITDRGNDIKVSQEPM